MPCSVRPAAGRPSRSRGADASPARAGADLVYGFHAVRAALAARRRPLVELFATPAAAERLAAEIAAAGLRPRLVEAEDLSRRLGAQAVHQGVLLEVGPLPALDLSEIESRSGLVLVLDQITDPHNVGAILRTAAAFAVDALVTPTRRAPELSGVLAKAASGGADLVPIVEVVNLARALDELGDARLLARRARFRGADGLRGGAGGAPARAGAGRRGQGAAGG